MKSTNFKEFYKKYFGFSLKIANKIVDDMDAAQDIVQEVFYSLYKIEQNLNFHEEEKLYGLVKKATINKALDYCKHGHTKREFIAEDEEMEDYLIDKRCNIEAEILHMEAKEYIKLVLQKLRAENPMNYDILMKVKYLDISPDIVAKEYGLTRNGINNRIFRTKKWLEREMSRLYKE